MQSPVLLLAAGQSSRMGSPKGLLDFNGRPWVVEQLNRFEIAGTCQVILILGHEKEKYIHALESFNFPTLSLQIEINPQPQRGTYSSLVTGLKWLSTLAAQTGCFILPIDVPCPQAKVWRDLQEASNASRCDVFQPLLQTPQGPRTGHPVLLAPDFQKHLLTMDCETPEARLDVQIRRLNHDKIRRVPTDDTQIRLNLNTPEEWIRYCEDFRTSTKDASR